MSKFKCVKEFVYENRRHIPELICDGEYKGYYYAITSLGTHPCAYVKIPKENKFYQYDVLGNELYMSNNIDRFCNGGLTYSNFGIPTGDFKDKWFIGWDYGHCWDFTPMTIIFDGYEIPEIDGVKWTNDKIIKEIKDVIDCLIEMEEILNGNN